MTNFYGERLMQRITPTNVVEDYLFETPQRSFVGPTKVKLKRVLPVYCIGNNWEKT